MCTLQGTWSSYIFIFGKYLKQCILVHVRLHKKFRYMFSNFIFFSILRNFLSEENLFNGRQLFPELKIFWSNMVQCSVYIIHYTCRSLNNQKWPEKISWNVNSHGTLFRTMQLLENGFPRLWVFSKSLEAKFMGSKKSCDFNL